MRAVRARPEAAGIAEARPGVGLAAFDRSLLLFALVLTAIVLAYFWTPTDPDVWWHLRNGAMVATTGAVPRGDIYSYTVPGAPWIMQQWLLETIMYGIEQTLGYWANVLLFALVSAGVYTLLFGTLRAAGAGRPLAVGAVLVGSGVGEAVGEDGSGSGAAAAACWALARSATNASAICWCSFMSGEAGLSGTVARLG